MTFPNIPTILALAALIYAVLLVHTYGIAPLARKIASWWRAEQPRLVQSGDEVHIALARLFAHATAASKANGGAKVTISTDDHDVTIEPPVVVPAPLALDPLDAVKRYIAGGLSTAVGMPGLYELQWLFALPKAAQVAWGRKVADAFDALLPKPAAPADAPPNATFTYLNATVGDIGTPGAGTGIRVEAQVYLEEVGGGFPFVGKTDWTL